VYATHRTATLFFDCGPGAIMPVCGDIVFFDS